MNTATTGNTTSTTNITQDTQTNDCREYNKYHLTKKTGCCTLRPEHSQKKISGQKFSQISGQISGHMTSRRPKPCTDNG